MSMSTTPGPPPRARRYVAVAAVAAAIALTVIVLAQRARRQAREEELVVVEGVRKVCKLSTIEVTLADYARRTVPKTIDLPFTTEPEAFLFYSGVVSAGFDVCDEPTRLEVDPSTRVVHVALPPARILSLDIKRFETINERSGFLNAISPDDRNGWYQDARTGLTRAALSQGVLGKAEAHARELLGDLVARWGYHLDLSVAPEAAETRR
ncbi:MAG TPA: DUF4230 domain-containing protein [Polyangia bacterium]|nr:DUF4230 domain-containing protein [Polyangia bacterium]